MRTIIKTGAVLTMVPEGFREYDNSLPPYAKYRDGTCIMHGDLHVIPNAFILYMAEEQAPIWDRAHGTVNFTWRYFFRKGNPFHTLVLPIESVSLYKQSIHVGYHEELDELGVHWISSIHPPTTLTLEL